MALNLTWVTPPGTIANFPISNESFVDLIVADTRNQGATFTFNKISGDLPPGMTLSATGSITGTPEYSTPSNNYFTTLNYSFIVRVIASDGRVLDGQFSIIITNTVNKDFSWVTPAGNLGTVPNGQFYSLKIEADSSTNLGIKYSFVSGELPPGMQLISHQVDKTVTLAQNEPNTTLKLSNMQTIATGDFVFGDKIPVNTKVIGIDLVNNIVALNTNTTATVEVGEVIRFYSPGLLQGVPTILDPVAVDESRSYRFTIRATNSLGRITDRAFSLNITNIYGPIIEPQQTFLGSYFDGMYYSQKLEVLELNPNVQIEWAISSGELPLGLTLNADGTISGYIEPIELTGLFGPAGYDGESFVGDILVSEQQYDNSPYQFNQINQNLGYTFTVQAFDGANYDLQTYVLNIVSRTGFSADSQLTIDDTYLTIDSGNVHIPVIRNVSSMLTVGRQDSWYAYKIDGYDFDIGPSGVGLTYGLADTLGTYDGSPFDPLSRDDANNGLPGSFDLVSATTSNLPGVLLDADSGWIYGKLSTQTSAYEEYKFGVKVCKTEGTTTYCSPPKYFTLPVIGDPNNLITWITPADLGAINNGTVSELAIEAVSAVGKDLTYTLVDEAGTSCKLPQGLTLLSTGEISGRATFEAFTLDDYTTTFDSELLTIDRTFTFKIKAETVDLSASWTRIFTIRLNVINKEPYESLYLKAMPSWTQRQIYNSLIEDTSIFDPAFIYRSSDPYYGIQEELKMLFVPGLTATELAAYQEAMVNNHFNKTYTFGSVKVATVLKDDYTPKYEVVYVEIVDPGELISTNSGVGRKGPPLEIDLTNAIANPYIDQAGREFKIVYPDSSENMKKRLEDARGYQDQSSLPPWMTSNQPDTSTATGFTIPLGYTKAVIIAYANPGDGDKIAYRIKQSGVNFNQIEFVVDRYQADNYYSTNYNTNTMTYQSDRETTFDSDPNINIGTIIASVTYAVDTPFNQINGRPVDYINNRGGIDGVTNFATGDTLVFAKQEQYVDAGPYDGWVDYSSAYIGDNIGTSIVEGYGSGGYDTYTVIPGFLEKIQGTSTVNQRGGVWRIDIVNGIVNLEFVKEIETNGRIRILFGKTLASAIMSYSLDLVAGQTVPYYKMFPVNPTIRIRTTFNNDSTKFFTYRDHYYEPGAQDKYVKFPQYGVFN